MAQEEHWYVLKLQPGFGPVVATRLRKIGIPVLLIEDQTSNPQNTSTTPSRTYVFAQLTPEHRQQVATLPGFICIAGVPEPLPVPDKQMLDLRAAVEAKLELVVTPGIYPLQSGTIRGGSLANRAAQLVNRDGVWHLAVPVAALDRTFLFALPGTPVELRSGKPAR
jgi:hypothetical protein